MSLLLISSFAAVLVIIALISFFKDLRYNCIIYSALGNNEYFKIIQRLSGRGISYRTKIAVNATNPGRVRVPFGYNDYSQYDIYVQKKDEHRANEAIHHYDKVR